MGFCLKFSLRLDPDSAQVVQEEDQQVVALNMQSVDPGFGDEVGSAFCDESGGGEEAENNAGG